MSEPRRRRSSLARAPDLSGRRASERELKDGVHPKSPAANMARRKVLESVPRHGGQRGTTAGVKPGPELGRARTYCDLKEQKSRWESSH
jgi:hypothetical protein